MVIKYTNIFLTKVTQIGIFGLKKYHLATLHASAQWEPLQKHKLMETYLPF
jgi:hypothetical protein